MKELTLLELKKGKKAHVIGCDGGRGISNKLNAMGVRPGKEIKKISDTFIGGPITIKVGNSNIAIGRGMASRIYLEVSH